MAAITPIITREISTSLSVNARSREGGGKLNFHFSYPICFLAIIAFLKLYVNVYAQRTIFILYCITKYIMSVLKSSQAFIWAVKSLISCARCLSIAISLLTF